VTITSEISLRDLAFIVCNALSEAGTIAVLTGGSAATFYAPEAHQSRDLDFVIHFSGEASEQPLSNLGFEKKNSMYVHPLTPYTLEFPRGPLAVGDEIIENWNHLKENGKILHVLTATDCVRDRLAAFIHWNDYASLDQAVAVARRHEIDLQLIQRWFLKESTASKYEIFASKLSG